MGQPGVSSGPNRSQDSNRDRISEDFFSLFSPGGEERKDGALDLNLNRDEMRKIYETEPNTLIINMPLPDGSLRLLKFLKSNIATSDFYISTSDGRKLYGKEYLGLHYQLDKTKNQGLGGLSFREDGLMGMITHQNGSYNIGEEVPGSGNYVMADDSKMIFPGWDCGTSDEKDFDADKPSDPIRNKTETVSCKSVKIAFEADFDLYTISSNSVSTATNFVTGLFNVVKQVYQNEQINLQLSNVFVWTSVDPYATTTDKNSILYNFATNRPIAGINGDMLHFLDCRPSSLGGIAYVGILCHPTVRHAFSSIYYSYKSLPAFSWSVFCVSHEMGHNFGSKHTHWCGWSLPNGQTGRIDSCSAGEGSCGTVTKSTKGTIMSYCYNTSGGVDMNLGFGPIPGNRIRLGLTAALCLASNSCLATPSISVDSISNTDAKFNISVSIPSNHNATSWSLLEGGNTIQNATLLNQNAATIMIPVTNKPNGTFSYSVQLNSGASSSKSLVMNVDVRVPSAPISGGNCTATGLMAWFDSNGKLNFRFGLSQTCTTYSVQLCRYDLKNPLLRPTGSETPVACGIRNNMTSYTTTTLERTAGTIERVASPQPSAAIVSGFGSFWYSVDVQCLGSGCTTTNRTRTYIFIPGL